MRLTLLPGRTRVALLLGLIVAVLLAVPATAYAADPPPDQTISGTVTDASNGGRLYGIGVTLYYYDAGWWYYTSTSTDYDGTYEFTGLPDDTFRVRFDSNGTYNGLYVAEYFDNQSNIDDAQNIGIIGGAGVAGIDAALTRQTGTGAGGSIAGQVTAETAGWPLGGIYVQLYYDDGGWNVARDGYTTADGTYYFTGLTARDYVVYFYDYAGIWRGTYYPGVGDIGSATPVTVGADAHVPDINQALSPWPSSIIGTVTDEDTAAPIENVWVYLYRDDGSGPYYYGAAVTDGAGHYTLVGIPAGNYLLNIQDGYSRYLNEWWQDADGDGATVIPLDGTDGAIADPQLALGGVISGTLTAEGSSDPIDNGYVSLFRFNEEFDSWEWASGAGTDPSGFYEFELLYHGTYRAYFQDYDGLYLPEYYENAAGLLTATDIPVTSTPQTGIDATLARGGRVAGFVTDAASTAGVNGAEVLPLRYQSDTGSWMSDWDHVAYADATGAFTVAGLPFGTYRFQARASGYTSEYWEDATNVELGGSWTFTDDTLQTGLNFAIARTGSISGTVYDLGGSPLTNVYVQAYALTVDGNGDPYWGGAAGSPTSASGMYTITGLPSGTYRVWFYDQNSTPPDYKQEYYAEKPNVWAADDVVVAPGAAVTGIDAHMSPGASISGTVRDESSNPLQSVAVSAFAYDSGEDDWERFGATVYTDAAGAYTIEGLADDKYRLGFAKSGYIAEYYSDRSNVFDADDVTIAGGVSVAGRDAVLAAGSPPPNGSIAGTVISDDTGLGVANVRVIAWRCDPITIAGGWYWANSTNTGAGGTYSMSVPPGVYHVQFTDTLTPARFLDEYDEDEPLGRDAAEVYVTSGSPTTVDASMATGGAITGTITDEVSGLPVGDADVYVYANFGGVQYYVGWAEVGVDGFYTMGGLPTGSYMVYVQSSTNDYRSEYYNDAPSWGTADRVLVDVGATVADINVALTPLATVAGRVTDAHDGRYIHKADVTLYRKTPDSYQWWNSAVTDTEGLYEITGVPAGEYLVRFSDTGAYGFERYVAEYHTDATRVADATPIAIGTSSVTVNEALASTGTWGDVSGSVIDAVTHGAVPDIAVRRWDPDGSGDWLDSGYGTSTSATGDWLMRWVPTGDDYRIAADPDVQVDGATPWTGIYPRTFFDNDATAGAGLPVAVSAGAQTVDTIINVSPESNVGYLSGHVIEDGTGADVAGATVTLYLDEGFWTQFIPFETDATGRFTRPVPAGTYAVELDDAPLHAHEYYEDVASGNPGDATPVVVSPAATTEMTSSLEPLGSVSGRVTADTGGAGLMDVGVVLYRNEPGSGWTWADGTNTLSDGTYRFDGVRYGSYTCEFADYTGEYVGEYYSNKPDMASADSFTVDATPATGIDAALADAGSISGTVVDASTSLPLESIYMSVYRYDRSNFCWTSFTHGMTDALGSYWMGGLSAGTYRVEASDYGSGVYAQEFYLDVRDVGDATDVPIASGEDVGDINFALEAEGSISGTIRDVTTSAPLESAWVYAYRYRTATDTWEYERADMTDSLGEYTLTDLLPATYQIYINRSGYITEYRHNQYDSAAAGQLPLGGGEHLTGIDEALSPGAAISGTVRTEGGAAIANLRVAALRYDTMHDVWTLAASDWTDSSGYYEISNLGDYEYRVLFADTYGRYAHEYYTDSPDPTGAAPVPVTDGVGQSGINAALAPYVAPATGTLSGTVRSDPGATALANITVTAHQYEPAGGSWYTAGQTTTEADGTYALTLGEGVYRLSFYDDTSTYLTEYHHNVTDIWDATDVQVLADTTTTVNEGLRTAARIRGTVTAEIGGAPLAGISLSAYRVDLESSYVWVANAETAADGSYTLGGLTAGDYLLNFEDSQQDYLSEWYDDAAQPSGSTWIALADAETRDGINAQLAAAGSIGGTVTNEATGRQAEGIRVVLNRSDGWSTWYYSETQTDDAGDYLFKGLPDGTYYLGFSDPWSPSGFERFEAEYYMDAVDLDGATPIVIDNQHETADAQLTSTGTWGSIAGTVTDGVIGQPVPGMAMRLYVYNGADFEVVGSASANTDASGGYEFPYVLAPAGGEPFRVLADAMAGDWSSTYVPTAHLGAATVDAGDNVYVIGDTYLTDVDVHMIRQPDVGWISGTVESDETSAPLPGIEVEIYTDTQGWVGTVVTLADGTWGRALPPGDYTVKFIDPVGTYATEWHHDAATFGAASVVPLGASGAVTVDEALAPAAHITGTVTNSLGAPLETWVYLYEADSWNYIAQTYSTGGMFAFEQLRAGTYWIWFDSNGDYQGEYWNNRVGTPDDITLTTGQTRADIDAVLTRPGTIRGTVTADDGGVGAGQYVYLYAESPSALGWDYITGTYVQSGTDWWYEFTGLVPGNYTIQFATMWGNAYPTLWYDTQVSMADANPVTVVEDGITVADQMLDGLPPDVGTDAVAVYANLASIEITATDLVTGVATVSYDLDGTGQVDVMGPFASVEATGYGDHYLYYWATDKVGHESDTGARVDFFIDDTMAPTVGSDTDSPYADEATITITAFDEANGSGLASISYVLDGEATATVTVGSVEIPVTGLGNHTLEFWADDNAGNETAHTTDDFEIIDGTAPTVLDDALASYQDEAVITITAADEAGGSGIRHISYKLDAAAWVNVTDDTAQVTVSTVGDHVLLYTATDNEGNTSAQGRADFEITDDTMPTVSDNALASYNNQAIVTITGTDNVGGSGIDFIRYSLDDGSWVTVQGATAQVTVTEAGSHTLHYTATDNSGNVSDEGSAAFEVVITALVEVPIAGDNRYLTAVEISEQAFPEGADWVVVATGANWPDALGGSALAGALDGPILLTATDSLPAAVGGEIDRLGATHAIILGGEAAVSLDVEHALDTLLGAANVERIGGADRYRTADLAAERTITELGAAFDGTAFVATGANYPDALAAAPLSAGLHWPLYLTRPTGLDAPTLAAMAGVDEVLILGGPAVVPAAIETALVATYGDPAVTRLAGDDRYGTAVEVAAHGVASGLEWNRLALATGEAFPDALAGGVLQGRDGSVMLLTRSTALPQVVADVLTDNAATIHEVRYLGGLAALTQDVRDAVAAILE